MSDLNTFFASFNEIQKKENREEMLEEHRVILKDKLSEFFETNSKGEFISIVKNYVA